MSGECNICGALGCVESRHEGITQYVRTHRGGSFEDFIAECEAIDSYVKDLEETIESTTTKPRSQTMNIEETKEAIKVMQAYVDGKQIEAQKCNTWLPVDALSWNWNKYNYRIAEPKPVELEAGMEIIHNDHRRKNFYIYKIEFINTNWVCYSVENDGLTIITVEEMLMNWHTLVNGTKRKLKAPEAK